MTRHRHSQLWSLCICAWTLASCAATPARTTEPDAPVQPADVQEVTADEEETDGDATLADATTIDMTASDAPASADAVAEPQRPQLGSFKLCGSGKTENCGPDGIQELAP